MASKRDTSILTPAVLVVATWLVTLVARVVFKRTSAPGSRAEVRERREQSTVYSILLAGALAVTEFVVMRLMRTPERD